MKVLKNLFLLIFALGIYLPVIVIAVAYTLVTRLFKPGELSAYFFSFAKSLSIAGATQGQHLFNDWFVKPDGYRFGAETESASHNFGENKKRETLYPLGYALAYLINAVAAGFKDNEHIEKAAEK